MSSFKDLRIVDNFYQTSAFFPMPTIMVGTLTDDGKTSFGPYSLCQPYYIAGKEYYAMLLCCRNSSNTAQNILKHKKCTLNFITDKRKYFKEAVRMGFPGDTPEEKMKDCIFTLEDGLRKAEDPNGTYPQVIAECFQVFECTWVDTLDNAQDDKPGLAERLPRRRTMISTASRRNSARTSSCSVDKILMKEKAVQRHRERREGQRASRACRWITATADSKNFWYTNFRRPIPRAPAHPRDDGGIGQVRGEPH